MQFDKETLKKDAIEYTKTFIKDIAIMLLGVPIIAFAFVSICLPIFYNANSFDTYSSLEYYLFMFTMMAFYCCLMEILNHTITPIWKSIYNSRGQDKVTFEFPEDPFTKFHKYYISAREYTLVLPNNIRDYITICKKAKRNMGILWKRRKEYKGKFSSYAKNRMEKLKEPIVMIMFITVIISIISITLFGKGIISYGEFVISVIPLITISIIRSLIDKQSEVEQNEDNKDIHINA